MVRKREFDEEQALDAAMRLFWEKGYEASSLSDLTAAMGIQRPSLYLAFGDKQGLYEKALNRYTTAHEETVRGVLEKGASVREAFRALFEETIRTGDEDEAIRGCFCINTIVELAPHNVRFEQMSLEHQLRLASIFEETLQRGIQSGELDSAMDISTTARSLLISFIGLTVLMKSSPDPAFMKSALDGILSLIR
ncbi:TetR/AcrR family transcriptional regulator [Paenibacillus sp. J22TS3]|uniref:TetR/AcrR family transcriptional regulator n=1 Tax=Paenibacillus sp. J22TS3 TaxID=2807192 RepID=UPI001B00D2C6|nr:TetR/AcrR family transcriptional regulator [Paenibacillus sp. J22TS3]GIP23721.1 TetR family transcriptional regulator [Paenibacillus sp. J22TS3]